MAEQDLIKSCGDEIDNIRQTTKWLLVALGALFAAMMSGFQLSALGFVHPASVSPATWIALGLLIGVIVMALALALRVMVGEGTTPERLLHGAEYERARRDIQAHWAHTCPGEENMLEELILAHRHMTQQVRAGRLASDDPEFAANSELVRTLLAVAAWRATLSLFKRLKVAMLLLLPIAATAAIVVSAHNEPKTEAAKPAATPVMVAIPQAEVRGDFVKG